MFFTSRVGKQTRVSAHAEKVSIIASGMELTGDIRSEGDVRIDGTVNGHITSKNRVVVSATGIVNGNIEGDNVDVHGTVNGHIRAGQLLSLKSSSAITGNLATGRLHIEPNAVFNGHCTMRGESQSMVTPEGLLLEPEEQSR
jgi:cytoskeletal protein CcmA (bactofilin family)